MRTFSASQRRRLHSLNWCRCQAPRQHNSKIQEERQGDRKGSNSRRGCAGTGLDVMLQRSVQRCHDSHWKLKGEEFSHPGSQKKIPTIVRWESKFWPLKLRESQLLPLSGEKVFPRFSHIRWGNRTIIVKIWWEFWSSPQDNKKFFTAKFGHNSHPSIFSGELYCGTFDYSHTP